MNRFNDNKNLYNWLIYIRKSVTGINELYVWIKYNSLSKNKMYSWISLSKLSEWHNRKIRYKPTIIFMSQ